MSLKEKIRDYKTKRQFQATINKANRQKEMYDEGNTRRAEREAMINERMAQRTRIAREREKIRADVQLNKYKRRQERGFVGNLVDNVNDARSSLKPSRSSTRTRRSPVRYTTRRRSTRTRRSPTRYTTRRRSTRKRTKQRESNNFLPFDI